MLGEPNLRSKFAQFKVRPHMFGHKKRDTPLFTSQQLAAHIVDTLVDDGLVDKLQFEQAVSSAKWEIDAQVAIGRVILLVEPK